MERNGSLGFIAAPNSASPASAHLYLHGNVHVSLAYVCSRATGTRHANMARVRGRAMCVNGLQGRGVWTAETKKWHEHRNSKVARAHVAKSDVEEVECGVIGGLSRRIRTAAGRRRGRGSGK
eukprot:6826237-Prymnesium_polylepis.1